MVNGSIGTPLSLKGANTQRIGQVRGKAKERQQHTRGYGHQPVTITVTAIFIYSDTFLVVFL